MKPELCCGPLGKLKALHGHSETPTDVSMFEECSLCDHTVNIQRPTPRKGSLLKSLTKRGRHTKGQAIYRAVRSCRHSLT